jgi:hypothetical protein
LSACRLTCVASRTKLSCGLNDRIVQFELSDGVRRSVWHWSRNDLKNEKVSKNSSNVKCHFDHFMSCHLKKFWNTKLKLFSSWQLLHKCFYLNLCGNLLKNSFKLKFWFWSRLRFTSLLNCRWNELTSNCLKRNEGKNVNKIVNYIFRRTVVTWRKFLGSSQQILFQAWHVGLKMLARHIANKKQILWSSNNSIIIGWKSFLCKRNSVLYNWLF